MPTDFSGRWIARLDESTFMSRTPRRLTAAITQTSDWLHVEMHVSFEGIDDSRMVYDARIVSSDEVRSGSVAQARWMGDDLVVEMHVETREREIVLRERWRLSDDGTQLTMAHRGDDLAGQTVVFGKDTSG
jgi:hypothetical protein